MISDFLWFMFSSISRPVISLLPTVADNPSQIDAVMGTMGIVNRVVDLPTVFGFVSIIIYAGVTMIPARLGIWAYHNIRGGG